MTRRCGPRVYLIDDLKAGTAFKVSVPSVAPAQVVHTTATELDADLVVIGRGVLKEAAGRYGAMPTPSFPTRLAR